MRIKLFESFHGKTPNILTYFEAESELSDKDGFAIVGITGDVEDVERVIKKFIAGTELPESVFDDASIIITDQSSSKAKEWKSDALIPFKGEQHLEITPKLYQYIKKENAMSIGAYFGNDDWRIKKESMNESSAQEEKLRVILAAIKTPEQIEKASNLLYRHLRWADVRALAEIAGVHDDVFKTTKK